MSLSIEFEEFLEWLCTHEDDAVVGRPGMCFHSPLACWLSEKTRSTIGVDGKLYGRALVECCQWRFLPQWAQLFTSWSERSFARPVTAYEAVDLLAQVEAALSPAGKR